MDNVASKLRYIRHVRQNVASSGSNHFDSYRPEYETILQELVSLAGIDTTNGLVTWIAAQTVEQKRLPEPASVRKRAMELCLGQGITVPDDSTLRDIPAGESVAASDKDDQSAAATTDDERDGSADLTAEALEEQLEVLEPYTTEELCAETGVDRGRLRSLLNRLIKKGTVTRKKPPSSPTIWVRHPPKNTCPNCGREFEVKFIHPVLSSVQFCAQCGTQL